MFGKKGNVILITIVFVLGIGGVLFADRESGTQMTMQDLPEGGLHWHPTLTLVINEEPYEIPANVGITIGKNIDSDVSGMQMSPIHTHDFTGVLHMEQPYPRADTLTLGYFFKVWDVPFSSECVLEWCNDATHAVKMYVNGERGYSFEKYAMHDGDVIEIAYEESLGERTASNEALT